MLGQRFKPAFLILTILFLIFLVSCLTIANRPKTYILDPTLSNEQKIIVTGGDTVVIVKDSIQ